MNHLLNTFITLYIIGAIITFIAGLISTGYYAYEMGHRGGQIAVAILHPKPMALNIAFAGASWFALEYVVGDLLKLMKK